MKLFSRLFKHKTTKTEKTETEILNLNFGDGELGNIAEKIQQFTALDFVPNFTDFKQTSEEFFRIIEECTLLEELVKHVPEIAKNQDFKTVYDFLIGIISKHKVIIEEVKELSLAEDKLSEDILRFTQAIQELSKKFKLSADWEGKKPTMIALGEQLNAKRELTLVKETELDERLKDLFDDFKNGHICFIQKSSKLLSAIGYKK